MKLPRGRRGGKLIWVPYLPIWSEKKDNGNDGNVTNSNDRNFTNHADFQEEVKLVEELETNLGILLAIWNGLRSCTRHPLSNFLSYHRLNHQHKVFTTHLSVDSVPVNIQETLSDARWIKAIGEEMNGLHKNETWDVVLPLNFKEKNSIGCKWIFTIKYKVDDSIERKYILDMLDEGCKLVDTPIEQNHNVVYAFSFGKSHGCCVVNLETEDPLQYAFVGDNPVKWRSKRQLVVAQPSVEVEFKT
ncbi:hypothetical protein CK203_021057 [Vitis vinifera]|uniref:Mitochondrial protein n=1 Tax=Vitis vinifera TaxID=29760 RepID=A0A438JWY0_VITVI|nr:hypothetical protein CK203_021057 [Vitis vinifera]